MTAADARAAAARIVGRVVRDGAYSNIVSRVETSGMNSSDRNVAHALAYDVIRHLDAIDSAIAARSKRPLDRIEPPLLDLLRVGTAELAQGDRPDALTVDAVVRAAKRANPAHAGFANGVLRALGRGSFAIETPVPTWLRSEMRSAFDDEEITDFWEASMSSPVLGLRGDASDMPDGARPVEGVEGAYLASGSVPEAVEIQDPASVAVGNAVGASPGDRVLDIAAAPGGKTLQLVATGADVVAMDVHPRRAADASRRVSDAAWLVADGRRPPFGPGSFDRVLLDAPCSGLGTLRRRPEIVHRSGPGDVAHLATLQHTMLESALQLVAPGGRLIYSVCTVTPSETIEVVEGRGARSPEETLPGRAFGDGWLMAPHLGPTDGMFVAVFER